MKTRISQAFLILLLMLLAVIFYRFSHSRQIISGIAILVFGMYLLENGFSAFAKGPLEDALKRLTRYEFGSFGIGAISTAILQSSSLITVITISFLSAGLISLSSGVLIVFGANIGTTATTWLVASVGLKFDIAALALPFIAFGIILNFQKTIPVKGLGNILNGLGFFFLGIEYMKQGFEGMSGLIDLSLYSIGGLQGLLIFTGIGILITVIMQSSSAAMTLVLTSLNAGQVDLDNALALAIGSNVGTTITAVLGSFGAGPEGKKLALIHFLFNFLAAILALTLFSPFKTTLILLGNYADINPSNHTMQLAVFHTLFNVFGVLTIYPFRNTLLKLVNRYFEVRADNFYIEPTSLLFSQAGLKVLNDKTRNFLSFLVLPSMAHALSLPEVALKRPGKARIFLSER